MTHQRRLLGTFLATTMIWVTTAEAQRSFSVDAHILIAECLSNSDFCIGFVTGVVQAGQTTGSICELDDNVSVNDVVQEVLLKMELFYEYRSRPAENFVLNTTKAMFCD